MMQDMYEVTLECKTRFKVKTRAHSHEEAEENVMDDFNDMTLSEFTDSYDGEFIGCPDVGSEVVD